MSSFTDWFSHLDPAVSAALVSLVVAVLTMISGALIGPSMKFAFDKRLEWQKLDLAYRSEQRKALKDHLARHRGRFLEAADALGHRFWNYQQNEAHGWLKMEGRYYGDVGYYPTTFAYRVLVCLSTARQMEREALYIDAAVAANDDFTFLKALKLTTQVWTDTLLFEDVALFDGAFYDTTKATDHFFRDHLISMADEFTADVQLTSFSEFKSAVAHEEHPYVDVFRFFDGLDASEDRLRHDRLICAHLVLLTTLNRFGYDFQKTQVEKTQIVIERVNNPRVLTNLKELIRRMKLDTDQEFARLLKLIDERQGAGTNVPSQGA
jgi:hypothetical protein